MAGLQGTHPGSNHLLDCCRYLLPPLSAPPLSPLLQAASRCSTSRGSCGWMAGRASRPPHASAVSGLSQMQPRRPAPSDLHLPHSSHACSHCLDFMLLIMFCSFHTPLLCLCSPGARAAQRGVAPAGRQGCRPILGPGSQPRRGGHAPPARQRRLLNPWRGAHPSCLFLLPLLPCSYKGLQPMIPFAPSLSPDISSSFHAAILL